MTDSGWKRPFDDPIPLPRGRQLVTLRDAAEYITKLPETEQHHSAWMVAVEAVILVAETDGPTIFARIGVMRTLNRHVERVFDHSRKPHHWGKRNLKGINENRFPALASVSISPARTKELQSVSN